MKNYRNPTDDKRRNRIGLALWLVSFTALVVICTALSTAALVRHSLLGGGRLTRSQNEWIERFAALPSMARGAAFQLTRFGNSYFSLEKSAVEKPHWVRRFPAPEDPGYMLLSGLDAELGAPNVRLIRIADGHRMATWNPDWDRIHRNSNGSQWAPKGAAQAARSVHPLLLDNGDIIFNTSYSLVRMGACEKIPQWILQQAAHHSIELSADRNSIWVPSVSETGFPQNPWLHSQVRDDSLLEVSLQGEVLRQLSFSKIMQENGLEAMLLGTGAAPNRDPIHINQISVAIQKGPYWERGDLLISARHLSALFLYRPSTGKITWYKQGPWMSQHSARFVDDHRISVLSNNVVSWARGQYAFVTPNGINHVQIYDFNTKTVSEPFAEDLEETRPATISEGRAELLSDGGLFLEETNYGRVLRFGTSGLMWSFINDLDEKHVGSLSWSRYMTAEQARIPLANLANRETCVAPH